MRTPTSRQCAYCADNPVASKTGALTLRRHWHLEDKSSDIEVTCTLWGRGPCPQDNTAALKTIPPALGQCACLKDAAAASKTRALTLTTPPPQVQVPWLWNDAAISSKTLPPPLPRSQAPISMRHAHRKDATSVSKMRASTLEWRRHLKAKALTSGQCDYVEENATVSSIRVPTSRWHGWLEAKTSSLKVLCHLEDAGALELILSIAQ
jgi:hypothetical protein